LTAVIALALQSSSIALLTNYSYDVEKRMRTGTAVQMIAEMQFTNSQPHSTGWLKLKYPSSKVAIFWQLFRILP